MAACGQCGKEIHDDAWVCGLCGALVVAGAAARETGSEYEYAAAYQGAGDYTSSQYVPGAPVIAGSTQPRAGRPSRLILTIAVGGLAAVLAIVFVWLFVLRGAEAGVGFAGTWKTTTADATRVVIFTKGDGYELSIANKDGESIGPFVARLVDGNLATSFEAAADSDARQQAAAALFKQIVGGVYQGFTMVFSHNASDDTLRVTLQGVPTAAGHEEVLRRVQ